MTKSNNNKAPLSKSYIDELASLRSQIATSKGMGWASTFSLCIHEAGIGNSKKENKSQTNA